MPHPVACIEWRAGTEYDGIYRNSAGTWIDHHQAHVKYRLQSGVLARFRRDGKVRYLRVRRAGIRGWAYLNHDEDLARAAAEYHRSQAERYQQARRQQAPNGEWYLSPGAFAAVVGISATTRDYWRRHGCPILHGESLEIQDFPAGNGHPTPYYSERQAGEIVEAREAAKAHVSPTARFVPAAIAAKRCGVDARLVRRLAREGTIEAELIPRCIRGRTQRAYFVSASDLRKERCRRKASKGRPQTIADALSVEEAAAICNVHQATVNKWIKAGKIGHENLGHAEQGGRRFVVSRCEVLEFAGKQNRTLAAGGEEDWLYLRQARVQAPAVTPGILRYYRKHAAPVLGRTLRWRLVTRPAGLKCRHKDVRQFLAEDVRRLAEWLAGRDQDARRSPAPITGGSGSMPSANQETIEAAEEATGEQAGFRVEIEDPWMEQMKKTHKEVLAVHESLSEIPKRTAEEVYRQMSEASQSGVLDHGRRGALSLADRLVIDLASSTATLDGARFTGVDPDGLRVLSALLQAHTDLKTPLSKRRLREKYLPGCGHDTTLSRWVERLPGQLRELIDGTSGSGLRLTLPPI